MIRALLCRLVGHALVGVWHPSGALIVGCTRCRDRAGVTA